MDSYVFKPADVYFLVYNMIHITLTLHGYLQISFIYMALQCRGVLLDVVPLFQQSATSIGWTTDTGPHHWPNSHL